MRFVTDDLGRRVELPDKVDDVISLAPNLTEIIFAVGGGDKLVGVTTFCDHPPAAASIRRVSDTQKPNIESIVALKPQVVLVSTASQLEAFMGTLEQQGIKVFVTSPNSLEDVYKSIEKIGEVLGLADRAADLVDEMKGRAARLSLGFQPLRPKVFVQIDKDSLYTVGRDSYITDVIAKAGGLSVTADLASAYPKVSRETARALNPDIIVISESENNRDPNEVFSNSPAVRNGRVYRVNADLISRPGPRLIEALELLADRFEGASRE